MTVSPEQLEAQLLQLPSHVRARLAEALLASLDDGGTELDVAWADEGERRANDLRTGNVRPVPSEDAHARARANLK